MNGMLLGDLKMQAKRSLFIVLFTAMTLHNTCVESEATILNHSQDLTGINLYSDLEVYDSPPETTVLNMYDGVSVSILKSYDNSEINIYGGSLVTVDAYNSSTFNLYGGHSISIIAFDTSTVNFWGGSVMTLSALNSSTVNLYGYGFEYIAPESTDPFVIGNGGTLNGFWQNGESFSILLNSSDNTTYDHVNLITIPEPGTVLLFALGGLVLGRRRRD